MIGEKFRLPVIDAYSPIIAGRPDDSLYRYAFREGLKAFPVDD